MSRKPYSVYVPEGAITPHAVDPLAYRREYAAYRRKHDPHFRKAHNQRQKTRRVEKRTQKHTHLRVRVVDHAAITKLAKKAGVPMVNVVADLLSAYKEKK